MKLLSWVHGKINGRSQSNTNKTNTVYASNKNQTPLSGAQKEEFSDWPQGFLSIGTLFIPKPPKHDSNEHSPPSSQNPILDFTLEEVKELQMELNAIMSSNDLDRTHLSSSIKEGDNEEDEEEDEEEEEESDDQDDTMIVPNNNAKDVYLDNNGSNATIGKKSLSFLLKKMFVCGVGGLSPSPTPSLRDPILSVPKSRMSKILRAMLRKKIYPQSSCPNMSRKKYLGNRQTGSCNYDAEDEFDTEGDNRTKWDKSDTEYIVLEI